MHHMGIADVVVTGLHGIPRRGNQGGSDAITASILDPDGNSGNPAATLQRAACRFSAQGRQHRGNLRRPNSRAGVRPAEGVPAAKRLAHPSAARTQ